MDDLEVFIWKIKTFSIKTHWNLIFGTLVPTVVSGSLQQLNVNIENKMKIKIWDLSSDSKLR